MARLRTLISPLAFLLLIGFSMATMEDTFYCSDEVAGESHADESECCLQCLTVHNMATAKAPVGPMAPLTPEFPSLIADADPLNPDPHLSQINRPPIFARS